MPDTLYYHGGQRGLKVGGAILSPSVTGAEGTLYDAAREAGMDSPARYDRVYVTTDWHAALLYAALHPSGGAVYTVEPRGELVEDPDCRAPGLSYECESARIVRVYRVPPRERQRILRDFVEAAHA